LPICHKDGEEGDFAAGTHNIFMRNLGDIIKQFINRNVGGDM
jgi:hypothetical protein